MTVHKEGFPTLIILILFLGAINLAVGYFFCSTAQIIAGVVTGSFFLFILQFFRYPNRKMVTNPDAIISACDGEVVVIEETSETEYYKDKRIQVSVFMSALNVHINWMPLGGIIKYYKHHHGLFLLAKNPKSSTENERTSIVVEDEKGRSVLFRQIAGIMARRIIARVEVGKPLTQGHEFGFIKFGSRVDFLLPLDADIKVKIGDKIVGRQTVIAEFAKK